MLIANNLSSFEVKIPNPIAKLNSYIYSSFTSVHSTVEVLKSVMLSLLSLLVSSFAIF